MTITRAGRNNTGRTPIASEDLEVSLTLHALDDNDQFAAIGRRLHLAHGQLGEVVRMLDEGFSCEEIVAQMAAVNEAVNIAAFKLISAGLKDCLVDPGTESGPLTEKFHKLFLSLA